MREQKAENGMDKAEATKLADDVISEALDWDDEASKAFVSMMPEYIGGAMLGNDLSNSLFHSKEKAVLFSVIQPTTLEWINSVGGEQIKHVTETTQKEVARIVRNGFVDGLSNTEIAKDINSRFKQISVGRGRTIAQTEIHNTFMFAREENFKAAGIKKWRWLTSRDEAVRGMNPKDSANHVRLDGQVRKIGSKFSNGLRRPGDPSGPPREIINCRCEVIPV